MKVLICSTGYNSINGNSVGVFQLDQARALKKYGIDVRIASVDFRSFRRRRKLGTYLFNIDDIMVAASNFPLGRTPLYMLEEVIIEHCAKCSYELITQDGWIPDIIHAHFCDIAAGYSHLARKNKIPFVVTEHYSKMHQSTVEKRILRASQQAYTNADALIAVSESLSKSIFEKTGISSTVVPNIVDTDIFSPSPLNVQEKETIKFVSAGHLKYVKGMDVLLNAFAKCKNEKALLYIMGDGAERKKLEEIVIELDIADKVIFTGEYTRKEFQTMLSDASCFVLASRSETFGVVLIEAMAAGIPVITTKCGGPEDFVLPETGVLVDPDNIEQLSNVLDMFIEKVNEYDKRTISEYIKNKFSSGIVAEKIVNIYDKVLK